jgi:hypothetical protein
MKERLRTWERKLLRKIYGAINEKGQWRIRRNMELNQLYKDLRWIGHVERMKESVISITAIQKGDEEKEDQESGG